MILKYPHHYTCSYLLLVCYNASMWCLALYWANDKYLWKLFKISIIMNNIHVYIFKSQDRKVYKSTPLVIPYSTFYLHVYQ